MGTEYSGAGQAVPYGAAPQIQQLQPSSPYTQRAQAGAVTAEPLGAATDGELDREAVEAEQLEAVYAAGLSESDVDDVFSSARHGRVDEIEKLLERGLPVDVRDSHGNTLLTIACQNGNKRVAKSCLRRSADINARNYKGNSPLHYCFSYGYGDTLGQYLIEKGADADARNNAGKQVFDGI